jgi:hypothetical protein
LLMFALSAAAVWTCRWQVVKHEDCDTKTGGLHARLQTVRLFDCPSPCVAGLSRCQH